MGKRPAPTKFMEVCMDHLNDGPGEEDGPWAEGWDERCGTPTPPAGYTAEELEQDNPYNQWMYEK